MSWTNVCHLSFQNFDDKYVYDETNFKNNAEIIGDVGIQSGCARFNPFYIPMVGEIEGRLEIPVKDESLNKFIGIRIEADIIAERSYWFALDKYYLTPYVIIESDPNSLGLYIDEKGSLSGVIQDAYPREFGENCSSSGLCTGWGSKIVSKINAEHPKIEPRSNYKIIMQFDGIRTGNLLVNGNEAGFNGKMLSLTEALGQQWKKFIVGNDFCGNISKIRIDRRSYEEFWSDAFASLLYYKTFRSCHELTAIKEIESIVRSLDSKTQEDIINCSKERTDKLLGLIRSLRDIDPNKISYQKQVCKDFFKAWGDLNRYNPPYTSGKMPEQILHGLIESYSSQPGFLKWLEEFKEALNLCQKSEKSLDGIGKRMRILFPNLPSIEDEMNKWV